VRKLAEVTKGWDKSEIDKIAKALDEKYKILEAKKDEAINSVVDAVFAAWYGPDSEDYVKNLYDRVDKLYEQVGIAFTSIKETLDEVNTNWKTFQDNNKMTG